MNTDPPANNLIASMAQRYSLEPEEFKRVIKATCGLQKASDEEFLMFIAIAHEHKLNPLTREIYAFIKPGGGIQAIIGVDGWYKKANEHPAFNGLTFRDEIQGGQLVAVTAIIYRKDRSHAIEATEYMRECKRNTEPWQKWPARMLRHKAAIQCIRIAFNLAGVMDPDEAERYAEILKTTRSQVDEDSVDDLPGRGAAHAAVEGTGATTPSPHHEAEKEQPPVAPPPPPPPPEPEDSLISEEESDQLVKAAGMVGLGASKLRKYVLEKYGVGDTNQLRKSQAAELAAEIRSRGAKK